MGVVSKGVLGLVLAIIAYIVVAINKARYVPEVPVYPETWWGKGDPRSEDHSIKPFKVDVSKQILDDLKERLDRALPLQTPLEGVKQNYGMNSNLLQKIVDHWKNNYNWTERQLLLNQYPHYTTNIQGLKIHFIHIKPSVNKDSNVKVLPLLLVHGWPGSVREFYEIIPILSKPQPGRKVVFELIIPSLPGYGFSEATSKPGLSDERVGQILKNLMIRLGHEKFYAQGGDWGAIITSHMSVLYPENLLGLHSNMCLCMAKFCSLKQWLIGTTFPSLIATEEELPLFAPVVSKNAEVGLLETGYAHIQSTKPDTVGVALRDSPIGLAAYILEKFTTWTNRQWKNLDDGGLTKKFTLDQLLDNVMIYWVTRSITTSQRLYSESFNKNLFVYGSYDIPSKVPTACARFAHEISVHPESLLKYKYPKLVQAPIFADGGHFAAFEVPEVLAKDIYDFIEKIM